MRATLDTQFSTNTIQNLKANVIIPSYEADTNTYVLFSNLNYAEFIGRDELIRDIALASSAAPAYLPAHSIGSHLYDDGGIYLNTPAEFGKTLAQILKPNATRCCILSLGTGIGQMGFDSGIPDNPLDPPAPVTTIKKIFSLYNVAITGAQESIARTLFLESQYTLNNVYSFRFQPMLSESMNAELDNSDTTFLTYLHDTAIE